LKVSFRLGSVSPEGFKCDIETDLVSILEDIGESLFTAVNPEGNAVENVSFDSGIERFGRKAENVILYGLKKRLRRPLLSDWMAACPKPK